MDEQKRTPSKGQKAIRKKSELILIGALVAIILVVIGVTTYRSIVNSDAAQEKKAWAQLNETLEQLSHAENIRSVDVARVNSESISYTDLDPSLFGSNIRAAGERITDPEAQNDIIKGDCITVFYADGTYDAFFLRGGRLYWGISFEMEWPALMEWLKSH